MCRRVNFTILAVFLLIFSVLAHNLGYAHPGRTDANGGHYNRKTGEYHKHVKEDSQPDEIDTDPVVNQNTIASDTNESELKLAAWNIRIMSNKSRTDAELQAIARTLFDYDFIAIVELRDEVVLQRTQRILAQMGKSYNYEFSPAVGRGVKERYAFLYREDRVSVVSPGELYPDAADGRDNFSRDPYWATFRAGEFDFSVIAVHVIWGDTVGPRKAEVKALAEVYEYVQDANGDEEDVLRRRLQPQPDGHGNLPPDHVNPFDDPSVQLSTEITHQRHQSLRQHLFRGESCHGIPR